MIKKFKDKFLEELFNGDIQATTKEHKKIRKRLDAIDSASKLENIRLPGYELHELKGNKKGTWSIKTTGNW
jgi:proteic killer suppression protein